MFCPLRFLLKRLYIILFWFVRTKKFLVYSSFLYYTSSLFIIFTFSSNTVKPAKIVRERTESFRWIFALEVIQSIFILLYYTVNRTMKHFRIRQDLILIGLRFEFWWCLLHYEIHLIKKCVCLEIFVLLFCHLVKFV